MVTVPTLVAMPSDSYALNKCLRMIRHCLDLEERRRLSMALALREERRVRIARFCHRFGTMLAKSWISFTGQVREQ